MNKVFDTSGRLIKLIKDGEIIWTEEDSVRRDKISDQSKQELVKDIENDDLEAYARKTFEILTGETIEEAKK